MTPSVSSHRPCENNVEKTTSNPHARDSLGSSLRNVEIEALAAMLRGMAPADQERLAKLVSRPDKAAR
jgi:hypothetical protein